jgi:hypothetical protein
MRDLCELIRRKAKLTQVSTIFQATKGNLLLRGYHIMLIAYLVISYVLGFLFACGITECFTEDINVGIVILIMSPLTAPIVCLALLIDLINGEKI